MGERWYRKVLEGEREDSGEKKLTGVWGGKDHSDILGK